MGFLLHALQRVEFGEELGRDDQAVEPTEADGVLRRNDENLLQLAPDALGREVCEVDGEAELYGLPFDLEPEARGELRGAQDAQGVLDEGLRGDGAQQFRLHVCEPPMRVDDLAVERVFEDGVDGEVAAARGLFEGHGRVAFDVEAAVPAPRLALAPREAHVQILPELVDGESLADDVDAAEAPEQLAQRRGVD